MRRGNGHGSWVMWVMGQLCDGSHGSWVLSLKKKTNLVNGDGEFDIFSNLLRPPSGYASVAKSYT